LKKYICEKLKKRKKEKNDRFGEAKLIQTLSQNDAVLQGSQLTNHLSKYEKGSFAASDGLTDKIDFFFFFFFSFLFF